MTDAAPSYSRQFLEALPKTDLHVHLDGSLRLSTLIELAEERGVKLPSYTEEGLLELVFKENYRDLPDYLNGFQYTSPVLCSEEALERLRENKVPCGKIADYDEIRKNFCIMNLFPRFRKIISLKYHIKKYFLIL